MPNKDNPHGFRYVGRSLSGGYNSVLRKDKDVSEGTAIFRHDLVELETDGNIAPGGTPGTTRFYGVSLNHGAALTATKHDVIFNPDALYAIQDNNDTDGVAAADIGLLANVELNTGGTLTLISGHELDESSLNTTSSLDLRLISLLQETGNAFGANADVIVVINKHLMNKETTGV